MNKILVLTISILALSFSQVHASNWKIDAVHSGFFFDVQHIFSTVRGHFNQFSGDILFDPDNLANSRIQLEVKVDSIFTNDGKRDSHLRSADFFDSGTFPVMTFDSSKISHAGGNVYLVDGTITIKGVSKDVQLKFKHDGKKAHPLMKGTTVAGLETSFTINRLDYGVGNGKFWDMGVVGKDVDVLVSLEILQ